MPLEFVVNTVNTTRTRVEFTKSSRALSLAMEFIAAYQHIAIVKVLDVRPLNAISMVFKMKAVEAARMTDYINANL